MRLQLTSFLLLSLVLLAPQAFAKPVERVPEDGSLAQAIQRVSERGTIDIAGGTYAAPANGFRVRNKSLTLRARGGAAVVLDGQGLAPIFRIEDQGVGSGRAVAFEGITFRNGFSADVRRGGGVTVEAANAVFVSCAFEANAAVGPQAHGGAVQVVGGSIARFVNSRFADNTSELFGGAIYAIQGSEVHVAWSELTGNRTDMPGHGANAAGGAIYVFDAAAHVTASHFEANASGFAGGALYAFGTFDTPGARLTVDGSTFVANRALPDPCCAVVGPPSGGAILAENQAAVAVRDSRFEENVSNFGGAVASYRAAVAAHDSVFRGNRAVPHAGVTAAGGTFNLTSNDFSDPTTAGGTVNRRPAALHVTSSLIQGRFGSTAGPPAQQGGCVFAVGDINRLEGNGVPRDGGAADNRVAVTLEGSVLADCDVETGPEGTGFGGALFVNLADLTVDGSLVADSDARGDAAQGGAVRSLGDSLVRATGTTFARNVAEDRGGAVRMTGGRLELGDCFFLENDVTPGEAEPIQRAPGAALDLAPTADLDLSGFVASSIFTDNVGLPIVDVARSGGTFNDVVYNGNQFHSTTFGDLVYKNQEVGFGGLTVAELNDLVLPRPGGAATDKSEVDNVLLADRPRTGRLVAVPARVLTTGTPRDPGATSAFLGYAWNGAGAARLAPGPGLPEKVGLEEANEPGDYRLSIDGETVASATVGAEGCSGGPTLCLNGERFLVEVSWRDFAGNVGDALVVDGGSDDSGLFYFFSEDNWEMLVKVLDGCGITGDFWVFAAATTNVEYTLRVTDKLTGATKSYFNPLGNAAAAITDTAALDACDAKAAPATPWVRRARRAGPARVAIRDAEKQGGCALSDTNLCLNRSRFRLEVEWKDFGGNTGAAQRVPFGSDDSGLFFFFSEDNWEMLVKVLTGCGLNQHYWVFAAATTNVEYTLTVTDTETGREKSYFNRLGNAAAAITDTEAFATCP